ncbi:TRAP transporter small permease [Chloroflexota bacterium]
MKSDSKIDCFEKWIKRISGWLFGIACVAIVAMILITVVDLIGLKLFRWKFAGAIEISGLLGLIIIGFAISFTQVLRGHTVVDVLISRLSKRYQVVLASIVSLFGLIIFTLMAWQMYSFGGDLQLAGRITPLEQIPLSPFAYAMAVCCLVMSFVLLLALVRALKGGSK